MDEQLENAKCAELGQISHIPETKLCRSSTILSRLSAAIPRPSVTTFLNLTSWACALGGLLFGYGTSIISDSIHFMTEDLRLTTLSQGVLTSSLLVGAALGALVWGRISDGVGRRRAMLMAGAVFVVGNLCSTLAPTFAMLVPARLLLGFSIGGYSAVVPILLAELSPAPIRAQMVTRNTLNIVGGQLLAFVVGAVLGSIWVDTPSIWRWMNALSLLPAFVLIACTVLFVPESPRWLVSVGRSDRAFDVLCRVRASAAEAQAELEDIEAVKAKGDQGERVTLGGIVSQRWLRNCTLLGVGVALSQQIVGVAAPMYYGTYILEKSGMDIQLAMIVNIAIGVVSVVAMAFGQWMAGRACRRPMLLTGFVGSACAHLLSALCSWLLPQGNAKGVAILVLMLLFCAFMQFSITTVTWFMLAEIFPLHIRGITMGLCTVVVWLTKFLQGLLIPIFMESFGIPATFGIFCAFCIACFCFAWAFLPETMGKTLEELEEQFKAEDWTVLKSRGTAEQRRRQRAKTEQEKQKF